MLVSRRETWLPNVTRESMAVGTEVQLASHELISPLGVAWNAR